MDTEKPQNPIPHDMAVALMQRDIQYMNVTLLNIANEIKAMEKNYATKTELHEFQKTMEKRSTDIEKNMAKDTDTILKALGGKVDQLEFKPIKNALSKINWLLIGGVIVGLLNLVMKSGS